MGYEYGLHCSGGRETAASIPMPMRGIAAIAHTPAGILKRGHAEACWGLACESYGSCLLGLTVHTRLNERKVSNPWR